jgi:predicted dehydrogenase
MPRPLGIGVLGLHEGRTLLVGLTHSIPDTVSQGHPLQPNEEGRSQHAIAVAGCDLRPEKIDQAKKDCPNLFYTTDYQQLLARNDVDIVAIYTPDAHHADHIVQAFEAGKHVICTKPVVNSFEGAKRILKAGRETGRKLLAGQSTRFFEPFRRQRVDHEQNKFGQLEFVDAQYCHRMDWFYDKSPWAKDETDWVFLGMSHPIDLIRWYMGRIETVSAVCSHSSLAKQYRVKSPDIYSAQFQTADGRIGRAYGHYGLRELPTARNSIELVLYGSDGTSLAQYHDMRYLHTGSDGAEIREDFLYEKRGYYFNNEVHGMHYGEFSNYAEYFAHSIIEGFEASPGLEEAVETLCLMEAVRLSAQEKRPVSLAPLLEQAGL